MKLTENQLRNIIQKEIDILQKESLMSIKEDVAPAEVGKDIKGNAAAEKASSKISGNTALKNLLDQITTTDALASFLQDVLKITSQKGIDQKEAVNALKKVLASAVNAKTTQKK